MIKNSWYINILADSENTKYPTHYKKHNTKLYRENCE